MQSIKEKSKGLLCENDISELSIKEELMRCPNILKDVLRGITDVIGVYKPDHKIMFYNEAGYDFYKKSPKEVKGKKCYEMLGRKEKCEDCLSGEAIRSKSIVRMERYIPELNKHMDCICNPVFDENGKVIFIVEQLRDITEKKNLENILKTREERYRSIVNLLPDAMIIISEGEVVYANQEALKLFGADYENIIGKSIYNCVSKYSLETAKTVRKRVKQILQNKDIKTVFDYMLILNDNNKLDIETTSSYLKYKDKPAIQVIFRNITEMKKGLTSAAKIQKKSLQSEFPIKDKCNMETLYIPAKTVSGDFYHIHKINDELVIGILLDVSGKGITAALNISAFNVLFYEALLISNDPNDIVHYLNEKIVNYLGENYIAACCFSLNFKTKEAKVIGAGINEFIYINDQIFNKFTVKGPFLGMFQNSTFDEKIIQFQSNDKLCFYSDGLDPIFEKENFRRNHKSNSITDFKNYLARVLNDKITDIDGIKDDCTLIALEIK